MYVCMYVSIYIMGERVVEGGVEPRQPISSLWSLQSYTPSHWRRPWIQIPLLHWNWSPSHTGCAAERKHAIDVIQRARVSGYFGECLLERQ